MKRQEAQSFMLNLLCIKNCTRHLKLSLLILVKIWRLCSCICSLQAGNKSEKLRHVPRSAQLAAGGARSQGRSVWLQRLWSLLQGSSAVWSWRYSPSLLRIRSRGGGGGRRCGGSYSCQSPEWTSDKVPLVWGTMQLGWIRNVNSSSLRAIIRQGMEKMFEALRLQCSGWKHLGNSSRVGRGKDRRVSWTLRGEFLP